ncbi:MAG: YMGG-like glycine zipper-containing protein [Syntrophales bacterium]
MLRFMTTVKRIPKRGASRMAFQIVLFLTVFAFTACYATPHYEVSNPGPSAPVGQVYFYPKAHQTTEQQSRDHYECYNWAIKQTGFDPSQSSIPPNRRVKVVPMPPPGHDTAVLAITGAVLGALIGGPHHAGQGALIGAGSGAVAGAASDISRQQYAQQLQEAYANRDQALDPRYEGKAGEFRRAMSACLEGRGYSVR